MRSQTNWCAIRLGQNIHLKETLVSAFLIASSQHLMTEAKYLLVHNFRTRD